MDDEIAKLTKDLKDASRLLSAREARFLVDSYYAMQDDRIRAAHQGRTLAANGEPNNVLDWLLDQRTTLEKQVARALDAYSGASPVGQWMRSVVGIGPIIAAGLLANIDIKQAPTAGHIWRFAGLDPTSKWNKGEKRPWNASLKRLCFLVGESFVKVSSNEKDTYGKLYKERKEYETAKNDAGDYAEQAAAALKAKKFGDDTQAKKFYQDGKLPPGHLHMRAKRYAVKMFLSNMHEVWYWHEVNEAPPKPFAIAILGHAHYFPPPNWTAPTAAAAE